MNTLKKNLPLLIGCVLGIIIGYLALTLHIANNELERSKAPATTQVIKIESKANKYWLEQRIEQANEETEKRIKDQESEGDTARSVFEKFTN